MFNHTYNNHFKYYIDGELFGERTSEYQKYTLDVGSVDADYYRRSNYQKELLRIADLQYQDLGSDLVLFLSGGTDSEIVARSFANIGIKPKCIIIRFANGLNGSEVKAAEAVAVALGLPYSFYDIDVQHFYLSGQASDLAKKTSCNLLPFVVFFKAIADIGQASILCCELQLNKIIAPAGSTHWYMRSLENVDMAHVRFSQQSGIPVVQEWFSYTPEIMLYYLTDPAMIKLVSTPTPLFSNIHAKNKILRQLVPGLFVKEKTTGYENLNGLLVESMMEFDLLLLKEIEGRFPYLFFSNIIKKLQGQS